MPLLGEHLPELDAAWTSTSRCFEQPRPGRSSLPSCSDLLPQRRRDRRRRPPPPAASMISCCSSSGRSSKSSGSVLSICSWRYASGSSRIFCALVPHALQAAADGVDAGGEAALEHGHREAERPAARRIVACGLDRLVLDVAGQRVVEIQLVAVDLKLGRLDVRAW